MNPDAVWQPLVQSEGEETPLGTALQSVPPSVTALSQPCLYETERPDDPHAVRLNISPTQQHAAARRVICIPECIRRHIIRTTRQGTAPIGGYASRVNKCSPRHPPLVPRADRRFGVENRWSDWRRNPLMSESESQVAVFKRPKMR
jgi:hypothetical protein